MIHYLEGDILHDVQDKDYQVLILPVNCNGNVEEGISTKAKTLFPVNWELYRKICTDQQLSVGAIMTSQESEPLIVNFPIRESSEDTIDLTSIRRGLMALLALVEDVPRLTRIALPALGCGPSGLSVDEVKSVIEEIFTAKEGIDLFVYENMY